MPLPAPLAELFLPLANLPEIYLGALRHDLTRYVVGAGGLYLLINCLLARRLAARKIRPDSPGWRQKRREILLSLRTVLIFAASGSSIALGVRAGLYRIGPDVGGGALFPTLATAAALIVLHDAWFYWSHRLMHRPKPFRAVHAGHHRSRNPSPFTSYAFDSGEAVIHALFLPTMLLVLPAHPVALLVFTVHMMVRNAMGHCGYELFPARADGSPRFGWLTSVTHHDLHHADARYNLGLYFSWWDRWCGTEHPDYIARFRAAARPIRTAARQPAAIVLTALALSTLFALPPAGNTALASERPAAAPVGRWATPGLGGIVDFGPCPRDPATRCGRLVWAWSPKTWSNLPADGLMVRGLVPAGDGGWRGELHNPEDGRTYRGTLRAEGPDRLRLEGCALVFCASQTWVRLTQFDRLRKLPSARCPASGTTTDGDSPGTPAGAAAGAVPARQARS